MEKQTFNVADWLEEAEQPAAEPVDENNTDEVSREVEAIIRQIEARQTDLTREYRNWIAIGFAFVNAFGEAGRPYFHRVSKFYPHYELTATDKQYDSLLKSNQQGITIKTFFFLAKQEGMDIRLPQREREEKRPKEETKAEEVNLGDEENPIQTPFLPSRVYENLPPFLSNCCHMFQEGIERDIFLLSALTVLSGCLPKISGMYFNKYYSPHLYLFVTGPSASGKGTMNWARYLAQGIHEELVLENAVAYEKYQYELQVYESLTRKDKSGCKRPEAPVKKMFFIPANCSTSALTQVLAANNFKGIIFESEADTLANTTKQDWGDSSDIFRKAFHHENTSMARRKDSELIEIRNPHLAVCLSGTPKQVINLMPEVENGLFSRFMYYYFQDDRGFLNPFESYQDCDYDLYFTQRGYEVYHLYKKMDQLPVNINFKLTQRQGAFFTDFFQKLLGKNKLLLSRDLDANIKRLGVITFRIAMILSAIRYIDSEAGEKIRHTLICSDQDFHTAMSIAETLEAHAVAVFQQMPKNNLKGMRLKFFEKLPEKFKRQDYVQVARDIGLNIKTADHYIALFKGKLLNNDYNEYSKIV